jgi:hypothetical protein
MVTFQILTKQRKSSSKPRHGLWIHHPSNATSREPDICRVVVLEPRLYTEDSRTSVTRIVQPDNLPTLEVLVFVGEAVLASDVSRWEPLPVANPIFVGSWCWSLGCTLKTAEHSAGPYALREKAISNFAVNVACLTPTVTRIVQPDNLPTLEVLGRGAGASAVH